MSYQFGKASIQKLQGVHPNLVKVMNLAIQKSSQDFSITEGVRTLERQKELLAKKLTQTLKSNHIKQEDGFGHAVDVAPYPLSWDLEKFYPIVEAVRAAAKELGVKVRWGGAWAVLNDSAKSPKELVNEYSAERRKLGKKAFIDGPHFELYP